MRLRSRPLWLGGCLLLCAGCSSLSEPQPSSVPKVAPATWSREVVATAAAQPWLQTFQDATLESLVTEALQASPNVQVAASRVKIAQTRVKALGVSDRPDVSVGAGTSLDHAYSPKTPELGDSTRSYSVNMQVSWEADLWDRLGNQERAAVLTEAARAQEYVSARLALAANIARGWYNAAEAEAQLRLLERRLFNLQDNLEIVEEGFRLNLNSALDVHLARSNVASQQSRVAAQRLTRDRAIQALEVLLGRVPTTALAVREELPALPAFTGAGLPSELLQRRPDLLAAERRLKAADETALAAYKAQYPRFSLSTSVSSRAEEVENLLDLESVIWSLGVNLTQPLWNGTALEADLEQANAETRIAALEYNQALLTALQEVESALVAEDLLERQEAALRIAVKEAQAGEELAQEQYVTGLVNFVTVLEAQRRSFDAQSSLLQVRNGRLQNRIQLYLALGGDFAPASSTPNAG